jgi:hypothetical protein
MYQVGTPCRITVDDQLFKIGTGIFLGQYPRKVNLRGHGQHFDTIKWRAEFIILPLHWLALAAQTEKLCFNPEIFSDNFSDMMSFYSDDWGR